MKQEVIRTADNSFTIRMPDLDEHYHSIHGARTESMHVFIAAGLLCASLQSISPIRILEVGMGTGLNVLLSVLHAKANIHYTALEPHPLSPSILSQIIPSDSREKDIFHAIHVAPFDKVVLINDAFQLLKLCTPLLDVPADASYHLIYYDAFGPRAQPEMWEQANFEHLFERMEVGGILVTYCAKGDVRRALQAAGFRVDRLPGPPHKREMLRAYKDA